jgi:Cu(I)/Ag(I) efflux system membrane fusion protein
MKKKNVFLVILLLAVIGLGIGFVLNSRYRIFKGHTLPEAAKKEILYYRNPMNPQVTSPVPMKDSMGMDYVPVYKEEAGQADAGIYISPQKQQLIGAKKEKIEKRELTHQILTVGRVAYDPDLYVAQEEYLQAAKMAKAVKNSVLISVTEQSASLLRAAEKKLLLLGMTKAQIEELAGRAKAEENLYLPGDSDSVWVYITIYEYELGLIKEGMPVEIDAVAFPGEVFLGKIAAITPVLDSMTRSARVRAEVEDKKHRLKPEMFVNVKINVNLGEKLAVPEEAVINTGKRTVVVVADEQGNFFSRDIKLGQKAEGFYEVLDGLSDGDSVVTSGNFLIDSESRLQSAISQEHEHGQ